MSQRRQGNNAGAFSYIDDMNLVINMIRGDFCIPQGYQYRFSNMPYEEGTECCLSGISIRETNINKKNVNLVNNIRHIRYML